MKKRVYTIRLTHTDLTSVLSALDTIRTILSFSHADFGASAKATAIKTTHRIIQRQILAQNAERRKITRTPKH